MMIPVPVWTIPLGFLIILWILGSSYDRGFDMGVDSVRSALSTQIRKLKDENLALKRDLTSTRNELNSANAMIDILNQELARSDKENSIFRKEKRKNGRIRNT